MRAKRGNLAAGLLKCKILGLADKRLYPVMCCYLLTLLAATHRASGKVTHGHTHLDMRRCVKYAAAVWIWRICKSS